MDKIQEFVLKQKLMSLTQAGRFAEAEQLALNMVRSLPKDEELWFALAQIQQRIGKLDLALEAFLRVTPSSPRNYLNALTGAAELCIDLDQSELGLKIAHQLIQVDPKQALAQYLYGYFLIKQKKLGVAERHIRKAVQLDPANTRYLLSWAQSLGHQGKFAESARCYDKMKRLAPEDDRPYFKSLMEMNYDNAFSDGEIHQAHRLFGQRIERRYQAVDPFRQQQPGRLRIGYVSPDFWRHSVSYFIGPILQFHDRRCFEVFCYADVVAPDGVTERLKSYTEHWVDVRFMDDQQLYERIRQDQIDILIDLAAYTGKKPRIGVFARRAAPIQVTYLGYPNTTGLSRMDYRLVDGETDPINSSEAWCSERLLRMSKSFLCFDPEQGMPEVSDAPAERQGHITFGAFNAYLKITDEMLRAWAEILSSTPESRLYVKAEVLVDQDQADEFRKRCVQSGMDVSRLIVTGQTPNRYTHLSEYHKVDLHLDTYPYNGTTTTLEAMWMGVPTVTLTGASHRSRVGKSILKTVDMEDFIASSVAEYVDIAVAKAKDPDGLAKTRAALRTKLLNSPLTDALSFVRELEQHYLSVAQRQPDF